MGICRKCADCCTCSGNFLQSIFLLAIRLLWGFGFLAAGLLKFQDIEKVSTFFDSLGIPIPVASAYLVAGVEAVCGALLIIGLASRLASILLIIIMVTALATAHREAVVQIWPHFDKFSVQPPIPFLLTALTVWCFGPGIFSIDAIIKKCCNKSESNTEKK